MGLFDFLKKKSADEQVDKMQESVQGNAQLNAQKVNKENVQLNAQEMNKENVQNNAQDEKQENVQVAAQQNVQDTPFVKDMRHFVNGPWHQYDILIDARIYGWNHMVEWADYVAKADISKLDEVTVGDVGAVSRKLTAEYKEAGSIAGMKTLANEAGVLSIAGFSKVLEAPIKIVWFNQTNILRFFTPLGDAVSIVKYAETVIRRLFNTPDAMKIYNQTIKGDIMPHPNRTGQTQPNPQPATVISGEYDAELRNFVARMSIDQKKEVLECISRNDKILAVKICREAMGSGLKQAKDIVDSYEKYLM